MLKGKVLDCANIKLLSVGFICKQCGVSGRVSLDSERDKGIVQCNDPSIFWKVPSLAVQQRQFSSKLINLTVTLTPRCFQSRVNRMQRRWKKENAGAVW